MIKQNQRSLNTTLVVLDGMSVALSFVLAWYLRFETSLFHTSEGHLSFQEYMVPILIITPIYLVLYNFFKLYVPHRFKNVIQEFLNILKSNALGLLILVLLLFLFKEIHYSRYVLLLFAINCVWMTMVERAFVRLTLRALRKKGYNLKHILLVGASELAEEFLKRVEANRHWGYNVIGVLDDSRSVGSKIRGKEIVGKVYDLERFISLSEIDEVMITLEIKEYEKLKWIIGICEKSGMRTQIIPDYYKYIPARPYVEEVDGLPIINIRYIPLDNIVNRILKRSFDVVASLTCIILFSPLMLFTAAIIKLTSPGPIIFKQERIGLNRKDFMMYKFRSMHVQAPEHEKVQWTIENDPRKTKFGNFIRRTSIDELPQFFNVLKGDMSLVGPRPERPFFVDKFKEEIPKYMIKHHVRPGITGWAQVCGWRGNTSIEKRVEHDLYYIENWTFGFDIKILWLTIFKGFMNENAY